MGVLQTFTRRRAWRRSFQEYLQEWPGTDCGLDFWTLDFPIAKQEQHFVEQRKLGVAKSLSTCCLVALLAAVTSTVWLWVAYLSPIFHWNNFNHESGPLTPIQRTSVWIQMFAGIFIATGATVLWAVCRVPCMFQRISSVKLEIIGTFCMTLGICAMVFSDPDYVTKMRGHSPSQEWKKGGEECYHHSDVVIILTILGITQAGNMMIPIRWKVLLPMNFLGLLSYITSSLTFSIGGDFLFKVVFLVAILSMTTLGKRMLEIKERKAHCDLVCEKSLRCKAEFKLARLETERSELASDQKSESTELTERVFGGIQNSTERIDVESFIEKVAKLGKQEHWCLASDEVQLMTDDVLGKGGFGTVVRGVFHGAAVAVKVMADSSDSQAWHKQLLPLCNELRVIRQVRHPNIVGLHGAVLDTSGMALVVELVDGVTLQCFVMQPPMPQMVFRFSGIYGVSCGLKYLHARQPCIVHGDVKGGNVMLEVRGHTVRAKVLDFGLSRILRGKPKNMGGTLVWMAPEVYRTPSRPPEPSSDVFSFGRLLYLALAGSMPLSHTPMREVRHMLKTGLLPALTLPGRHAVEERLVDLLDGCLRVNSVQRPSMQTIQNTLLEAASEIVDLAPCVKVVAPRTQLPNVVQTGEGRDVEALPDLMNLDQQLPQDSVRLHSTVATRCLEQEQQQQHQQQQRSCVSGLEPLCDRLVLPGLLPTQTASMCASILWTVQRWNFHLPRVSCCTMHASFQTLQRIVEALSRVECKPDFAPTGVSQCQQCGLMFDALGPPVCDICGDESERNSLMPIQEEES